MRLGAQWVKGGDHWIRRTLEKGQRNLCGWTLTSAEATKGGTSYDIMLAGNMDLDIRGPSHG